MTLCYSRHQYAELVTHQDMETWLNCHQKAFLFFGGVPRKVIIDNPKCAVTVIHSHFYSTENPIKPKNSDFNFENGAPKGIRTSDLCLRRATLYPAELWVHKNILLRSHIIHKCAIKHKFS